MKLPEDVALLTEVTPRIGPHLPEQEQSGLSCRLPTVLSRILPLERGQDLWLDLPMASGQTLK